MGNMTSRMRFFAMEMNIMFDDRVDPLGKIEHGETKLVAFLDSTLNAIHFWEKNDVRHGEVVCVDLCGHLSKQSSGSVTDCDSSFPPECRLCFQIFKRLPNEFGKKCWLDFGTANVPMLEIVKYQRSSLSGDEGFPLTMKMHTVNDNTMAVLKIHIVDKPSERIAAIRLNFKLLKPSRVTTSQRYIANSSDNIALMGTKDDERPLFSEHSVFISSEFDGSNFIKSTIPSSSDTPISITASASANLHNVKAIETKTDSNVLILTSVSECFDYYMTEPISNKIGRPFYVGYTSFITPVNYKSNTNKLIFEKHQLDCYFKEFLKENAYFKDWISGANNINCPYYPSQVTVMDTQLFLPYSAYVIYEPALITPKFWVDALYIMSSRRGYSSVDEYFDFFFEKTVNVETHAIHAMDMVCQLAHTMEYIADQVIDPLTKDVKKIEIFGDALFTFDGDCDDLASVVFQMFDDFSLRQRFEDSKDDSNTTRKSKTVLRRMREVLKKYVPFMCIEGVTSASAQNQHDIKKTEITGAHAAIKCLPIWYVKQCISNWNPSHPIVNTSLSYDVNISHAPGGPFHYLPFVKSLHHHSNAELNISTMKDDEEEEWEKDLPILIGEGTGMLNSGGEPDPCSNPTFRRFVYSCKETKSAKKHLYPPKGTSPFYKAILFASTNRFIEDFKIGTFRFCQMNPPSIPTPEREDEEEEEEDEEDEEEKQPEQTIMSKDVFCRGVLFSDLIHMKEDIALIPYGDAREIVDIDKKKSDFLLTHTTTNEDNMTSTKDVKEKKSYSEFSDTLIHILKETLKTRLKPKPVTSFDLKDVEGIVVVDFNTKKSMCTENFTGALRLLLETSQGFSALWTLKRRLQSNVLSKWKESNRLERTDILIYYDDFYLTKETCDALYDYMCKKNVLLDFYLENHSSTVFMWRLVFKGII